MTADPFQSEIDNIVREEVAAYEAMREDAVSLIPQQPYGRQRLFLYDLATAREAMYGGAAGGMKSSALLLAALEYIDVPHYAALILRRNFTDMVLADAIMSRAKEWLIGKPGVHWDAGSYTFTFDCKGGGYSTLTFGHMNSEGDKLKYQGAAFQFCVAGDTRVLMADGSYKPIREIRPGDQVSTLLGPRRVLESFRLGMKPCVRLLNSSGVDAVVSSTHRLLTPDGWASPLSLRSRQSHVSGNTGAMLKAQRRVERMRLSCLPQGLRLTLEPSRRTLADTSHREGFAYQAVGRSDFLASDGERRESQPPQVWTARLTLLERALRPDRLCIEGDYLPRVHAGERFDSEEAGGFPLGYRALRDFDGERFLPAQADDQEYIPLRADAAGVDRSRLRVDGRANTRSHTRSRYGFLHPYTNKPLRSVENVCFDEVEMRQAGEVEVFDLRVEEASHYILAGGFISVNCGFDELTQFTKTMYMYLFSRVRRPAIPCRRCAKALRRRAADALDMENINGVWVHKKSEDCGAPEPSEYSLKEFGRLYDVPLRTRSATNPGNEGHEWVKERFIPEDYPGPEEARIWEKRGVDRDSRKQFHTYFVPSRLEDNPFLDQEEYTEGLELMDRITQAQLLKGDWAISATGTMYFDLDSVLHQHAQIKDPAIGELMEFDNEFGEKRLDFQFKDGGRLAVWKKPRPGHFYVIGADTASGKDELKGKTERADRDWSVAIVRDIESGEMVARVRGREGFSESFFGAYWARLSKWYNGAYLVPAVTGGYGRAALMRAIDLGLDLALIYRREDESGYPNRIAGSDRDVDLGFIENDTTRPNLYSGLFTSLVNRAITSYDAVTVNEYFAFEYGPDGRPRARTGAKDDCVTADALCVRGIRCCPAILRERNRIVAAQTVQTAYYGKPQVSDEKQRQMVQDMRRRNSMVKARRGK